MKGFEDHFRPAEGLDGIQQVSGSIEGQDLRIGICVSRYNRLLTEALLHSAVEGLRERRVAMHRITVVWVPGAYEIPSAIQAMARSGDYDVFIALGAVIWGETAHGKLIAGEVTRGLADISRRFNVPVIDGVVTAYTEAQARARCLSGRVSRGWYAAVAAVEMGTLFRKITETQPG
ncbi:MAG: 6,7-dimethyl-8-ribityllumazine synthase [Verrucomicrobia bacterium]|nr:MAG: 6,7-dimethyl-8-ribityllumazine synthase [Verrucomicrobiota bacterium]